MQDDEQLIPDATALAHSERLESLMRDEISRSGAMPFDRYMELVLYAPGLGYYTAGSQKFGEAGDFVTAPEISSLFSQCLANQCAQVLTESGGSILEFGAGSGIMAAHILKQLEALNCLPEQYFILDLSPDLKSRQLQTIHQLVPHLTERVSWLEQMPENFTGVMLGNEVLDAMPVSLFKIQDNQVLEQFVENLDGEFKPVWLNAGKQLQAAVKELVRQGAEFQNGYVSEINLRLHGWMQSLSNSLQQGAILLIDYGYTAKEYYHPERSMGTLICHYRHRAHDDPYKLVGLQDITANVDFSAVGKAAQQAGLQLAGFSSQANFLMANGLDSLVAAYSPEDSETFLGITQGVKVLMLPSQMGERFKVIGLTKNYDSPLDGFALRDMRDRL